MGYAPDNIITYPESASGGKRRFGYVAQDVIKAFEAAGLDWRDYQVVQLGGDTDEVEATEYYGLDYIEVNNIEAAALRLRLGV